MGVHDDSYPDGGQQVAEAVKEAEQAPIERFLLSLVGGADAVDPKRYLIVHAVVLGYILLQVGLAVWCHRNRSDDHHILSTIEVDEEVYRTRQSTAAVKKQHPSRPSWTVATLCCCAAAHTIGFVVLRIEFRPLKFSALWTSDCTEYFADEQARLARRDRVLQQASQTSIDTSAGNLYVAINAVPNRPNRYLTQTLVSLFEGVHLSGGNHRVRRIEVLTDSLVHSPEISELRSYAGNSSFFGVVRNPAHRRTPRNILQRVWRKENHSRMDDQEVFDENGRWIEGSVLHYVNALERCGRFGAARCLILDDDVLAAHDWPAAAQQAASSLAAGSWVMLKLFQPVWGNSRQNWCNDNILQLLMLVFPFGIGCGLLALCACTIVRRLAAGADLCGADSTVGRFEWKPAVIIGLSVFVFAALAGWAAGRANFEWLLGDEFVNPYGTCHMAQANMFDRVRMEASGLQEFLLKHANGSLNDTIDLLLCAFFKTHPRFGPMWTTSPSIFQHAGILTSHPFKSIFQGLGCRIRNFHEGIWKP